MLRSSQPAPRFEERGDGVFAGEAHETVARETQRLAAGLSRRTGQDMAAATLMALRFASAHPGAFVRFSQPRRPVWRRLRLRPRMSIDTFTTLLFLLGVLMSAVLVLTGR
jgi:hypothetical protein